MSNNNLWNNNPKRATKRKRKSALSLFSLIALAAVIVVAVGAIIIGNEAANRGKTSSNTGSNSSKTQSVQAGGTSGGSSINSEETSSGTVSNQISSSGTVSNQTSSGATVSGNNGMAVNPDYVKSGKDKNGKYTMYLTFDDGPNRHTESILDTLKKNNAVATFFVVGKQVEENPEIAKRIVDEGHTIAIHCYQHEYETIYASVESFVKDFKQAQDTVYEATGARPTIYRFPGGSKNNFNRNVYKKIIKRMKLEGNVYYDWNAMFGDAGECTTASGVIKFAKDQVGSGKDIVMLAHDGGASGNTKHAVKGVIDQFKKKYNFEGLTMETRPIQW